MAKKTETSLTIDKDVEEKLPPWYELYTNLFIHSSSKNIKSITRTVIENSDRDRVSDAFGEILSFITKT